MFRTILRGRVAAIVLLNCSAALPAAEPLAPISEAKMSLDHVTIQVANADASAAFYKQVFGMVEIKSAVAGLRWLGAANGVQLHLVPGRSAPIADNRSIHMAFATRDLQGELQTLKRLGIGWVDADGNVGRVSAARKDGVKQIYLRDPDGYWIEVNDAGK